jgi:hypothetical protein
MDNGKASPQVYPSGSRRSTKKAVLDARGAAGYAASTAGGTTMSRVKRLGGRLLLVALTCLALAGALAWALRPRPTGFATPAECLAAYREACQAGDAERYRRCLGEPLRSQVRQTYPGDDALAEALRRESGGLKGWVEDGPPDEQGGRATANVEEVRESGQRRLRFELERARDGWHIVGVEKGAEQAPEIRYGTRVGEESRERQGAEGQTSAP